MNYDSNVPISLGIPWKTCTFSNLECIISLENVKTMSKNIGLLGGEWNEQNGFDR
jgi:hypothetical protein